MFCVIVSRTTDTVHTTTIFFLRNTTNVLAPISIVASQLTCQSRTALGWHFQDQQVGFEAWCLDDTRPGNGCKPGYGTTGTCTPGEKEQQIKVTYYQYGGYRFNLVDVTKTKVQWNLKTNLDVCNGNDALGFVEMPSNPVHSLRHKVQHQV